MSSVVLFGGTSEIGLGMVRALVARGARGVVLAARDIDALVASSADLEAAGAAVEAIAFEALDFDHHVAVAEDAFARAQRLGGVVDVAIIAVGTMSMTAPLDDDPAAVGRVAAVNFAGVVSTGVAVAQQMRAQGHGTLVILSSVAGQRPRLTNFPYAASKAGLDAFADGLDHAAGRFGVRVVTVRPGYVRTRMTEGITSMPFATTPERVAEDTVRGLDRGDRVIWSPGIMRWIAIPYRLAPRGLFRLVTGRR
jgi:decaprenylphospho-beta-D-erythro-pentofuranosid-2-ulose 2-reductase